MPTVEQKTTLELKLEKLRQICDKSPDHPIALLALAETAFRRGLRLEALEAYQKVLRDESVAEARLSMAQMYRHHGLYQEALNEIRELFVTEPCYPEAHVFAQELRDKIDVPAEILEMLEEGCGEDELALARVRLNIARSLVLREGQELTSIHEANAGDPTYGYYIGETRKRLSYCEQVLTQLSHLEEARRQHLIEQERARQLERERQAELEALQQQRELERRQEEAAAELAREAAEQLAALQTETALEPLEAEPLEPADLGQSEFHEVGTEPEPTYADFENQDVHEGSQEAVPDPTPYEPPVLDIQPVEPDESVQLEVADETLPLQPELYDPGAGAAGNPDAPPEPALWDDLPRPNLATDPAPRPFYPAQDEYTLDLTPTLVGELPEPALPEPLAYPDEPIASTGLWEDPPLVSSGEEEPSIPEVSPVIEEEVSLPQPTAGDSLPLVEALPVENLPDPEPEPATGAGSAVDYPAMYQGMLASLEGLVQNLSKTRSVSSVVLLNRDGYVITEVIKDSISPQRLSEFMVEATGFLEAFSDTPQYWVLECAGGIVVIQSVDAFHFVIAIGQSGANFGALRFTMDRVRPNFEQVLESLR